MLSSPARVALLALSTGLVSCGPENAVLSPAPLPGPAAPPDSWALSAPGIDVLVRRSPYGYTVRDGAGREVLSTLPGARGDGYAPFAWGEGGIQWGTGILTKGHYTFAPTFDAWHDRFVFVEAKAGDRELMLRMKEDTPGGSTIAVRHTLRDSTLRVEVAVEGRAPRFVSAAFPTPADEGFLGFGERFTRTDLRGLSVYSWAEEGGIGTGEKYLAGPRNPTPNGEAMSYYPVPFFVSTRGYGFWLDTTWRSSFELATEQPDAWRVWEIGPSLAYEVYVPIPGDARPWPYHLVDLFTARTGRPMVPPAWAYGPRRRVGRGSVVEGVPEIEAMRKEDLAITGVDDAVHFLPKGSHVGNEAALADWTSRAHALGYKAMGYYNSLLAAGEDNPLRAEVQKGLDNGWFLKNADGTVSDVTLISGTMLKVYQVDFTSKAATSWFQSMLDWSIGLGYDGFMWDFGEYVQVDVLASDGTTGEQLHNLYPVLYDRAGHEHLEAGPKKGDWMFFARSGYTGSSRWAPMVWSGDPAASFEDSDGLPSMVRAAVNMGVSGAPNWGGDIGGFHCFADGAGAADGELLARWIQQGAMTPNMQDQNACSFAQDGKKKASIWTAPEAKAAWKTYARLHTRLLPYFWALARRAHEHGEPIVRHLFFEHPDRADLRAVDDTYYLGPALLVAPVVHRGERSRSVKLPQGLWLDWHDGVLLAGGEERALEAPLDKLPLLLRDGYLVPLLDPRIDTLAPEASAEIVGPGDVADVYDVVGLLSRGKRGAFALEDGGTLEAEHAGAFAAPALEEAKAGPDLASCAGCWRADPMGAGLRRVRVSHGGGDLAAGGLMLRAHAGRRVRWDLYLAEP